MKTPGHCGLLCIEEAIAQLHEKVATVHERVPCPACGQAVGERCERRLSLSFEEGDLGRPEVLALEHPHTERLRADGIALR